jgi:hypothetical protein
MAFGLIDGYWTYLSAIVAILVGLYLIAMGNTTEGLGFVTGGFMALGIGSKIERATSQ